MTAVSLDSFREELERFHAAAVEALERRMIATSLQRHGGNKTRAADELKVSRRNLIRLVQKYQLD